MGGVGIAAPQDAISAVFSNPAGMCFGPYCPSSQFDFAGTIFMPEPKAEVHASGQTFKADARDQNYAIPAIGFSVPIGGADARWRFGLSAYGVSGLGVDYRDTALDRPGFFNLPGPPGGPGPQPLASGTYSNLQLMKFAPTIAYQALPNLSVGTSFQINYSRLPPIPMASNLEVSTNLSINFPLAWSTPRRRRQPIITFSTLAVMVVDRI